MKIRCKNCFRVLNNDEEYCTRCGEHSDEIKHIMTNGIILDDEVAIGKKNLAIYFLIAFLVNGIINVIFGILFDSLFEGYNYGGIGTDMPLAITYFATSNSLFYTSIIAFLTFFTLSLKDFYKNFEIKNLSKFFITLQIFAVVMLGLVLITKFTAFSFVPTYIKEFLVSPSSEMLLANSFNLFKVIVILVLFAITEEIVFRKSLMMAFDEGTLLPDSIIVILQALISTVFYIIVFLIFQKSAFIDLLLCTIASFVFNVILGINFYFNDRKIFNNLIVRIIFIILLLIIL